MGKSIAGNSAALHAYQEYETLGPNGAHNAFRL